MGVAFKIQSTAFVSGSKGSSLLHKAKCIQFISKNPQSLKSSLVPKSRFWQSALLVLEQCRNQKFRASKTQRHRPYIPIPNRNRSPEREHLTRILRRRHSVALTLTPCSVNPAPLWFCHDWLCCRAAPCPFGRHFSASVLASRPVSRFTTRGRCGT